MTRELTLAEIIAIADDHFDEVFTIWEELAAKDAGTTMKDAVMEFVRRTAKGESDGK